MKNVVKALGRALGTRWFSGFVTAVVLIGVLAAAGVPWGGAGDSPAVPSQRIGQIRVKFPWLPEGPGSGGWIEIDSYHWGMQASPTRPSSGAPKVSEFVITNLSDASSLRIHQAMARGEYLAEVTIEVCRHDCEKGAKYMEFVMKDVIITGYSPSGTTSGPVPAESITMNFAEIKVTYFEQDRTGDPKGTVRWDCTSWPECVPG